MRRGLALEPQALGHVRRQHISPGWLSRFKLFAFLFLFRPDVSMGERQNRLPRLLQYQEIGRSPIAHLPEPATA